MCLDVVSRKKPRKSGKGYKWFYKEAVRARCRRSLGKFRDQKLGKWLKADEVLIGHSFMSYTSGFHILTSIVGAKQYAKYREPLELREVEYREAHTQGEQRDARVVVARRMKIGKVVNVA